MTRKGIKPLVHLLEGTYEKGVKVLAKELEQLQPFNAAFWNFAQMGCDGSALLAGILFLRKSLTYRIQLYSGNRNLISSLLSSHAKLITQIKN